MTLLYGKSANGTYYPVQVDETGQIIAVFGESSVTRPDLTAEFKSVILDDINNRNGPGLGYFAQGSFNPSLSSSNYDGTVISPGSVVYASRSGTWQIVGRKLDFNLFLQTSSISGLTGDIVAITGVPLPAGFTGPVGHFSCRVEYIVGLTWGRAYPPVHGCYGARGATDFRLWPNTITPAGGYPAYINPSELSTTEVIIYANGSIWLT